jgi:hypothetical protein
MLEHNALYLAARYPGRTAARAGRALVPWYEPAVKFEILDPLCLVLGRRGVTEDRTRYLGSYVDVHKQYQSSSQCTIAQNTMLKQRTNEKDYVTLRYRQIDKC